MGLIAWLFNLIDFFIIGSHSVKEIQYHHIPLEDHHLVKRKTLLLRYDWRNGIPVCRYVCHNYAETPTGKAKIAYYLTDTDLLDYLQARSGQSKDWFVKHGISRKDFLIQRYNDLKDKLSEQPF